MKKMFKFNPAKQNDELALEREGHKQKLVV